MAKKDKEMEKEEVLEEEEAPEEEPEPTPKEEKKDNRPVVDTANGPMFCNADGSLTAE